MKKYAVIIVLVVVSFGVGAFGGFLWASRAFSQMQIAKEVEVASNAAMDANTLAMLRLNDTTAAIESLELRLGSGVSAIAAWDKYIVFQPEEKVRSTRNRCLTAAKVYYESYPFRDDDTNVVSMVNDFLSQIHGRDSKSTCRSALCRLDDLRLASAGLTTNLVITNAAPK